MAELFTLPFRVSHRRSQTAQLSIFFFANRAQALTSNSNRAETSQAQALKPQLQPRFITTTAATPQTKNRARAALLQAPNPQRSTQTKTYHNHRSHSTNNNSRTCSAGPSPQTSTPSKTYQKHRSHSNKQNSRTCICAPSPKPSILNSNQDSSQQPQPLHKQNSRMCSAGPSPQCSTPTKTYQNHSSHCKTKTLTCSANTIYQS